MFLLAKSDNNVQQRLHTAAHLGCPMMNDAVAPLQHKMSSRTTPTQHEITRSGKRDVNLWPIAIHVRWLWGAANDAL